MVTRHNDINIVFLLVTVIALMIIPLPTPVVDTLIGVNMALSFTILMMTMYVRTVLDFSVFPTLLLFTTLFRVGLNITTTRLILLQADAGEIIFTFGEFALGGNFVVGAVVFLILTIVQFLVIAKGAERVAEVGARFTLDAMPGKQMSIDADMRARGHRHGGSAAPPRAHQSGKPDVRRHGRRHEVRKRRLHRRDDHRRREYRGRHDHRHHPERHDRRGRPAHLRHPHHRRRGWYPRSPRCSSPFRRAS